MHRLSTLALFLVGCGAATTTSTTPHATPEPEPPEPIAEIEEPAPEPPEPPAEGTQLAAGRLGSVLDGLREGDWEGILGQWGVFTEGPDVPSHHVLPRTTSEGEYPLHLLAWETFRAVPADTSLVDAARAHARSRDETIVAASNEDLAVVATLPPLDGGDGWRVGPESAASSEGAQIIARASVAVRGGTFVELALACDPNAACRAEDRSALIREIAASLRRGPRLRSGGEWELVLPHAPNANQRVRMQLPEGVFALPTGTDHQGNEVRRALHLATGREAMSVKVGIRPSTAPEVELGAALPEPVPTLSRFACAPFDCTLVLTRDDELRSALAAALAQADVEVVPADDTPVAIGGGRLRVQVPGPSISYAEHDDETESHVRFEGKRVHLVVRDTLRPAAEALSPGGYFDNYRRFAPDRSNVTELVTGDPGLTITRIVPPERASGGAGTIVAQLLVDEREGTGLIVDVVCHYDDAECLAGGADLAAAIAPRIRRGEPVATTRDLRVTIARRRIRMQLPEDYVVSEWYGEHHGGWGLQARHTSGAPASLEFEAMSASPDASIENTGRRTRRRTTLRLGDERIVMRERRRSFDEARIWGAELGDGGVLLIVTADIAERDRLLAALAAAEVTRIERAPCLRAVVYDETDDTLNLREEPSTHATVLDQIDNDTEVTIERTRGRWTRLAAPHEGWVWSASLQLLCDD